MKAFRNIILVSFISVILFSCSKGEESSISTTVKKDTGNEKVEEVIILEPVQNEGLISFLTGDVFITKGSKESYAEIGDTLAENDLIHTSSDGLCEIQIGTTAIISIQENTDFSLSSVSLQSEGNRVKAKVIAGMVAFKINKLLDNDRFTIDTPTIACGVRGTHFLINVTNDQITEVAVLEGKVAVLPTETESLLEIKETAPLELAALIDEVLGIETIIEAGNELKVEKADVASLSEQIQIIVEEVSGFEEKSEEEKTEIINQVEILSVSVEKSIKTIPKPVVLTTLNEEILKPLEIREFLPIQSLEEQKKEEKPLEYRALIINVEPLNAEIYLDDQLRGTGQISVLFPMDTELNLLIKSSGYEDSMDLLKISKETPTTYNYSMEREKREILLKVEPSDAIILLDGIELGEGDHSDLYPLGSSLVFTAKREGYNSGSIEILVDDNNKDEYLLTLSRGLRPLTFNTFPDDSEIIIDGKSVGFGNFSNEYVFGANIKVEVKKEGYKSLNKTFTLDEYVPNDLSIELDLIDVSLMVSTYPGDAVISINGRIEGKGKTNVSYPFGSEIDVVVERKGYESSNFIVHLSEIEPDKREVRLKALPLFGSYQLGSSSLVGELVVSGNRIVAADSAGFLHSITLEGSGKWSFNTSNRNNETSSPLIAGNIILLAGTKRFVAVSTVSGSVTFQKDLGSKDSLPFGNKPLYTGKAIVYPEQTGLRFLDPDNFSETGFLPLPELLMTTPSLQGNIIYAVDFIGTLYAVSLSDYSILWSSQTPLKQPAGLSLTFYENKGFIGDTKGNVIAVNLEDGKVLWSVKMPKRVTSNIVVKSDLAYVWSDGTIYTLSTIDGSESGSSFPGAVTPPLVTGGRIYYGNDQNKLLVHDIKTTKLLYEYELSTSITTCLKKIDNFIVMGLESGKIAIVNEEAFGL